MKTLSKTNKEILIITTLTFVVILAFFFFTDKLNYSHPNFSWTDWDHQNYIDMSTNPPFDYHIAPFCWRILTPFLARVLPFELSINYQIIGFLALWATGIMTYFMLKAIGFGINLSTIGVLLFLSFGWVIKLNLFYFWYIDPLAYFFSVTIIWCIARKKDLLLVILLAIGITAKESIIFLIPLYYTLNTNQLFDFKLAFRTVLLAFPSIIIFILLRLAIPLSNDTWYNFANLWEMHGITRFQYISFDRIMNYTIGTFSTSLVILPFFSIKKNLNTFLRFSSLIFGAYFAIFFAQNSQRVIIAAFPAILIMALNGIQKLTNNESWHQRIFYALPGFTIVALLIKKDWYIVFPLYEALFLLLFLAISIQLSKRDKNKAYPLGDT